VIEAGGFPWEDIGNQTEVPAYCWRFEEFSNLNKTNPSVDFDLNTEPQAVSTPFLMKKLYDLDASRILVGARSITLVPKHLVAGRLSTIWAIIGEA
jgi:hypothetical protein